jgi:hypothetical protein
MKYTSPTLAISITIAKPIQPSYARMSIRFLISISLKKKEQQIQNSQNTKHSLQPNQLIMDSLDEAIFAEVLHDFSESTLILLKKKEKHLRKLPS